MIIMSRIGKAPVYYDDKTQVAVTPANEVVVKGPKTALTIKMLPTITAKIEGKKVVLSRNNDSNEAKALHGLYRAMIQNAVSGVSKGFTKILELHGVGYRANVAGKSRLSPRLPRAAT